MLNKDRVELLEATMDSAKDSIELANALTRLQDNKDFQTIITEGYFIKEASRVVALKASPSAAEPNIQNHINDQITGIGQLNQYMRMIYMRAAKAEKEYVDSEEALNELLTSGEEV